MPIISVAAPVVKSASQPVLKIVPAAASNSLLPIVRASALGIGLAGLVFAYRRRSRTAVTLTVLCLLVGIVSFVIEPAVPAVEAQGKSLHEIVSEPSISEVEIGRQLFIAKGCIACHANSKVGKVSGTIDVGAPDLSSFSASPEALQLRLKDPSALKSDTWMPDLDLSDAEIKALIAFINSK